MKNGLSIFLFTVSVTLFYWYVGQQVPQKITYPPESTELSADMTTDEMVVVGEEIMSGKRTCMTCHTIGSTADGRFPDLGNIGVIASARKDGMTDIEYLAESIYDPNIYVVEGFLPGMPAIHKPPISLSDEEILTIIAYLQSLGAAPTVTMQTTHSFTGQGASASESAAAQTAVLISNLDGPGIFVTYGCNTCHSVDVPTPLIGPSLVDVGNRLAKSQIYESVLEPDLNITEGFPATVMKTYLDGISFYDRVSTQQLKVLVDYLESLKGSQ